MNTRLCLLILALSICHVPMAQIAEKQTRQQADGSWVITVDRTLPVEFLGTVQPFTSWDSTQVFENQIVRDENGMIVKRYPPGTKAARLHAHVDPTAKPLGVDPALQSSEPLHGFERALDLSVNGIGYTSVNPPDPCLSVGPNHVIQMINGGSGSYFRICDKNLVTIGASMTYMDNFLNAQLNYSGAGDPIVVYDALADRWLMSEFTSNNNNMIVAISQTANPTGAWYVYSYTATNFPDYPKYAVWSNCYVVTTNENTSAIYALPRANMLAGVAGSAVRFTVTNNPTIGFQACTPVHFSGGAAPPAGAPAMFMRMTDDAWTTSTTDVDRLELWNINYNATTPASSTITGPTALNTAAFVTELCGYTSFACMNQPGTTTTLDPLREVLMNRISYRNLTGTQGYEAIACSHVTDVDNTDRGGVRWYELHRTGGSASPWSIYQQGTWSPNANDRWMSGIAINQNGDIGLCYNISGTTGGNVYPGVRYTGRYRTDPLGQMTFAETTIVSGAASNGSNRYGDYSSLDVDPADGTSFYGTAQYNPAANWSTRMFKFSFAPVGCTPPTVTQSTTDNCGAGTFALSATIGANGDSPNYDIYTSVNGAAQTFNSTHASGTFAIGTYSFGTNVVVQVRHNANAACNQTLPSITSSGTSCCTAPTALVVGTCTGSNYGVSVNLTSMGSATSIAIQIDPDAGGANPPVSMQTVTGVGVYGPFGSYASGSPVHVILVHNLFAQCSLATNNFVKTCNVPGAGCGFFSNTTATPIVDNATTTSNLVVPAQGGATITDLNVYVNITHTYVSDLRLSLRSPANTTVNLISTGLCTNADNIVVDFDQTGANGAVGSTCPLTNLYVIPAASLAGFNGQLLEGTWTLTVQDVVAQDAGTINSWCLIPTLLVPNVRVSPKVFLEGPYNAATGLMSDTLRYSGLIPANEPYTSLGYVHTGGGGGETVAPAVLAVTGPNAIVDWMVVELRNAANSSQIVASRGALVQRDGDVVATDGTSPVLFTNAPGNYFVAVRHRNHLGTMRASALALSGTSTTVDLTLAATTVYGTEARKTIVGVQALWAGDVTFNHQLLYVNSGNDRDPILVRVGGVVPTGVVNGYYPEDVNLNGQVKYVGGANDRDPILANIGGSVPTANRTEQLP